MGLLKKLLFVMLAAVGVIEFDALSCASSKLRESSLSEMLERREVMLLNVTGRDLFISIRSGEQFVLDSEGRPFRVVSDGGIKQLFAKKLTNASVVAIPLDEDVPYRNISFRIWVADGCHPLDFYLVDFKKKHVTFVIEPELQTGLHHVTIGVEEGSLFRYAYYDFTGESGCSICRRRFALGEDVSILECGYILHKFCLESLETPEMCPKCQKLFRQHTYRNVSSITETKCNLCAVSDLWSVDGEE